MPSDLIDARQFSPALTGLSKLEQTASPGGQVKTLIQRNERARSTGDYRHEQET
jgi:hypothetical protein